MNKYLETVKTFLQKYSSWFFLILTALLFLYSHYLLAAIAGFLTYLEYSGGFPIKHTGSLFVPLDVIPQETAEDCGNPHCEIHQDLALIAEDLDDDDDEEGYLNKVNKEEGYLNKLIAKNKENF